MDLNLEVAKKRFTEMFEVAKESRDLDIKVEQDILNNEELMFVSYNGPLDNDWNEAFQKVINRFKWASYSCKYNAKTGRVVMLLKRHS